jgi:hypothetical protein
MTPRTQICRSALAARRVIGRSDASVEVRLNRREREVAVVHSLDMSDG